MIIGDLYDRNAQLNPNGIAYIYDDKPATHSQLATRIRKLANALLGRGVRRQERIAILAQNSPEYLEVYGAGETVGFITVAVNYRLAAPEIGYIVGDAVPTVLVFESQYTDIVESLRDSWPSVTHYICIGKTPDWAESYKDLLAEGHDHRPDQRGRPDETAYLIYTSGTTGRPKGAMLGQKGQLAFAQMVSEECGLQAKDIMFLVMPLYHVGAKCNQLATAWRGGTIVLHRQYDPLEIAKAIETHHVTTAHLAPLMVQELVDLPEREKFNHSSLRLVQYASGPMAVSNLRRAIKVYGKIFMQIYGMTESGVSSVFQTHLHHLEGDESIVRRLASAGQAPARSALRIVRPDGTDCDIDEPGEVLTKTPSLFQAYWNNAVATCDAMEDGWLHTGDVGSLDGEGYLFILDRKKDMIVSGGENIYPREVEEALYTHDDVAAVAVIGVPDERWGESVMAFVVAKEGANPSADELIAFCKTRIASYKKPKAIEFIDALPRLANQKIDKKMLREPYWSGDSRKVN